MSAEYSVDEAIAAADWISHMRTPFKGVLEVAARAYAERIGADESAVPFGWWRIIAPGGFAIRADCPAEWKGTAIPLFTSPPAQPSEGHIIGVLSCDGEWEGEARWESGEGAYVTQVPIKPAQEQPGWKVPVDTTRQMSDELRDYIEGMTVSVDVSTGEDDAGNRYFGTVTEVMCCPDDRHGVTLLVQDAEANFKSSPVVPVGFRYRMKGGDDAHLATPAQTVDVEAVREVIVDIHLTLGHLPFWAKRIDKLSQAIGDKT